MVVLLTMHIYIYVIEGERTMLFQNTKCLFVNGLVEDQQGKWCWLGVFGAEELGWIPLHCGGRIGVNWIVLMGYNIIVVVTC